MAYFPEGSYWMYNELFLNESLGSTFTNFTKAGTQVEIYDNSSSGITVITPSPPTATSSRRYAGVLDVVAVNTLTSNAQYRDLCNDFRQEYIWIGQLRDATDAITVSDHIGFELINRNGNPLIEVRLLGDGSIRVIANGNTYGSAVGKFVSGELVEVKVEISRSNDYLRPSAQMRVYVKGIEYCYDAGFIIGPYDAAVYVNRLISGLPAHDADYYIVTFNHANQISSFFTYGSGKNFADIDKVTNYSVNYVIPFRELLIRSNDRSTFKYLGDNLQDASITEQLNQISQMECFLKSDDMFAALQDRFTDQDDSDNNQNNFSFDNEIRLFMQFSRIVTEGVDGISGGGALNDFDDANATFVTDGVQVGDWLYTWNASGNHDLPRQIINVVSQTEVLVSPDWTVFAIGLQNYTIVRGMERYHDRYLGDYRFIGEFKRYDIGFSKGEALIKLKCYSFDYFMTQWLIWCPARKYYYKDFDRIFRGWETEKLLVGYGISPTPPDPFDTNQYNGGLIYNIQQGLMSSSLFQPIYDDFLTETRPLYTFINRPKTFLFDAIKDVVDRGLLQYVMYNDRENNDQRYVWFRDLQDKTLNQTTFIKGGNSAVDTVKEDTKIADTIKFAKGTEQYVDLVSVQGSRTGDDDGQPLAARWPIGSLPDRSSRQMFEADDYIRIFEQSRISAEAIYNNLSRIDPQDGYVTTEFFPQRDSWGISTTFTWADNGAEEYPGGPIINHIYNQTHFANGSSSIFSVGAHKHSQGREYRKPFSRIGETGRIDMDAAFGEDFVVYEQLTEISGNGILSHIRPETKSWDVGLDLATARRDIDRIAQNFIDPDIGECLLLPPDDIINIEDHIGVSFIDYIHGGSDVNPGTRVWRDDFLPFVFQDKDDYNEAHSYMFFYRFGGSPAGSAWIQLPVVGAGTNEIQDIIDTTSSILFGGGGGFGSYIYNDPTAPGANSVWCQLPGPGTWDMMIVLRQRVNPGTPSDVFVPNGNPPVSSAAPGVRPTPEQDDEVIEIVAAGINYSFGMHAIITQNHIVVV